LRICLIGALDSSVELPFNPIGRHTECVSVQLLSGEDLECARSRFGPHRKGLKALVVRAFRVSCRLVQRLRTIWLVVMVIGDMNCQKGTQIYGFHEATKVTKEEYYEYLFVCADDILAIGVEPKDLLSCLNKYFPLNLTQFILHISILRQS
jgi:hypothetical protein